MLRTTFEQRYAQKAQQPRALLIPETAVDDLLSADGKVVGIKARSDEDEALAFIGLRALQKVAWEKAATKR